MRTIARWTLLLGVLGAITQWASGCTRSASSNLSECTPGEARLCVGIGNCEGQQLCADKGAGFGQCMCLATATNGTTATGVTGGASGSSATTGSSGSSINTTNTVATTTGTDLTTTTGTDLTTTGGSVSTTGQATTGGAGGMSGTANNTSSSGNVSTTGTVADPGCGSHKWACWPMPNQPGSGLPNEASYADNGDGTITDNLTQLVWQAEQSGDNFNWQAAIDHCENLSLAGFDDWRMPTRIEVSSVLDHNDSHTGWSEDAFDSARGGFHHTGSDWILTITQTGAGAGNDFAWAFNMGDGIVSNAYSKSNDTPVRCVRGGGGGEGPSEPAVAPPNQYTPLSDEEVQDNYTGLIWQRGDSETMVSWQEAVAYCEELGLNGNTWRLPSIRELATLVDEAEVAPAINSEMFPDTQYGSRSNNWYWATPQRGSAAWGLNFDDGFTGTNTGAAAWNTFGPSWARCVR